MDIYAKKKMDHNSMSNMYKEIPNEALDTFKFGSVHYLLSGQGLLHLSPKKHPKLPPSPSLHQRGIQGAFLQLRRTKPQCLRLLLTKRLKSKF